MPEQFLTSRSLLRPLLMILAMGVLVGCTSDEPNTIGMGLIDTQFEIELEPMEITNTIKYSALEITDADVPFDMQEVLYLGSQGGNTSSALANFNFDDIYTDDFVDTLFTADHITSVNMRFMVLNDYQTLGTGVEAKSGAKGLAKDFLVYQLEAPFDSTAFPGPQPAFLPNFVNDSPDPDSGTTFKIVIPIYTAYFLQWMEQGGLIGFMVTEGNNTEEGLVGYASRDMLHGGSTLDPLFEDVPLGIILQVTFDNDSVLVIESVADISTFHETSDIPVDSADGFVMRTVLRSYPTLYFDYSTLPKDVFINRAVLHVVNDTLSSFGHVDGVIASEIDTVFFGDPYASFTLSELDDITTDFSGMGELGLDPLTHDVFQFNVTTSIQRVVNEAYEGDRGFILTGPEEFLSSYLALDPDLYFVEYRFHGTNDPDPDRRPRLIITYSTVEEFVEGGAQ